MQRILPSLGLLAVLLVEAALGTPLPQDYTQLSRKQIEALWTDLVSDSPQRVSEAQRKLAACPGQAVSLVQGRVKPVPAVDAKKVDEWIDTLGNSRKQVGDAAQEELEKRIDAVEPLLKKAEADGRVKKKGMKRLEVIYGKLNNPDRKRALHAVKLLERIGTEDARAVLEDLAKGAPGASLTIAASQARERLGP